MEQDSLYLFDAAADPASSGGMGGSGLQPSVGAAAAGKSFPSLPGAGPGCDVGCAR
jgi:hypothetical protein